MAINATREEVFHALDEYFTMKENVDKLIRYISYNHEMSIQRLIRFEDELREEIKKKYYDMGFSAGKFQAETERY